MLKRDVMNKLSLLFLLNRCGVLRGATRLQKLVFEIESQIRRFGNNAGFNYEFIRWHYGPYSKELVNNIEELIKADLVQKDDRNNFSLTQRGRTVLDNGSKFIENKFIEITEMVVEVYATEQLPELLEDIYRKHNVPSYHMGEVIHSIKL